jgi:hypothetical protein
MFFPHKINTSDIGSQSRNKQRNNEPLQLCYIGAKHHEIKIRRIITPIEKGKNENALQIAHNFT